MISERTLKQWRKASLAPEFSVDSHEKGNINPYTTITINELLILHQRILRLTQELMDWHLIKKQL